MAREGLHQITLSPSLRLKTPVNYTGGLVFFPAVRYLVRYLNGYFKFRVRGFGFEVQSWGVSYAT